MERDLVKASLPKDKDFMLRFMRTQMFVSYVEEQAM